MKTLIEFNNERSAFYKALNTYPKKNNIECPKCKGELSDANSCELLSCPPQRDVICESCGYKGYRFI